jgi:hypothetical protein
MVLTFAAAAFFLWPEGICQPVTWEQQKQEKQHQGRGTAYDCRSEFMQV